VPEGNTIHRLARIHNRDFAGRRVRARSPQGRFANEAKRLDGRRFRRVQPQALGSGTSQGGSTSSVLKSAGPTISRYSMSGE